MGEISVKDSPENIGGFKTVQKNKLSRMMTSYVITIMGRWTARRVGEGYSVVLNKHCVS